MAVFIRKENLGSSSGQSIMAHQMRRKIESLPGFKAIQQNLAEIKEAKASKLKEKYESNSEVQRWRTMNKDEQTREAINRMIPTAAAVRKGQTGKDSTHEEARKVVEDIANLSDRKKTEG